MVDSPSKQTSDRRTRTRTRTRRAVEHPVDRKVPFQRILPPSGRPICRRRFSLVPVGQHAVSDVFSVPAVSPSSQPAALVRGPLLLLVPVERYCYRVTLVASRPEAAHLDDLSALPDVDDREPPAENSRPGKQPLDLLRRRRRAHVDVFRLGAQQIVPDRAADHVALVSPSTQSVQHLPRRRRDGDGQVSFVRGGGRGRRRQRRRLR